jgi:hypothetical protein
MNLLARDAVRPRWYPTATAPAARVGVWMHDADQFPTFETAEFLGWYVPGQSGNVAFNPVTDRPKTLRMVAYSASGVPSVRYLDDAPAVSVNFKRETTAPTVTQIGAATTAVIQLGITDFTEFARQRRIRIADNSSMTNPSVIEYDSGDKLMPRFVDVLRNPPLQAAFTWSGNDPAANGFTKVGAGTTAADGAAWKITTTGSDAATNYTKNSFPSSPFTNGFTLEVQPPTVTSTEGDLAVAVRVDNGTKKYELTFTATQVKLNGGTARTHSNARVRLVVNAGGNTADLWIGTTKVEDETAGATGSANELRFGDLATTDDSEASWSFLAYALTPQEPRLTQTIWVRVSHNSGNGYGSENTAQSFTFADEGGGGGSAPGTEDQFYFWRQEIDLGV